MKRNNIILAIFGILFLVYIFLYANEFEIRTRTNFWIILTEIVVAISLISLLLLIKTKWWIKLLSLSGLIGFLIIGLPETGLWKFSLNKYVTKEKSKYIKLAKEIDKIDKDNLTYVSCHNHQVNSRPKLKLMEVEHFKEPFCKYINELDCVEVSLDKLRSKYLFVMSRFIGNGYGLLYCTDDLKIDEIFSERINGLEITSVVKVEKGWFYVSFT